VSVRVRRALTGIVIGLVATAATTTAVALLGPGVTALEWRTRDALTPALAPISPALVIIARDAASETRLGSGAWDRAVLARVVSALSRAGAAAIGLDTPLGQASAPGRGGAASDTMLARAIAAAGTVVVPLASDAGAGPAPAGEVIGHTLAPSDPDGVVRRVPLSIQRDGRDVPAMAVALAKVASGRTPPLTAHVPVDRRGRALLRWAPDLPVTPFGEVWAGIEQGEPERLRQLVEGKTVLVLTEPSTGRSLTPIGPLADVSIQAELLNAVHTGAWLREAPATWVLPGTLVLAALAAWLALALPAAAATLAVVGVLAACAAAVLSGPGLAGIVLPAAVPLTTIAVASATAVACRQVGTTRRLRSLEAEVGGIRDTLVRQESTVESLEEDLEAARLAVARSTGAERELLQAAEALRGQLAEARAQEAHTRGRLQTLEAELHAAERDPPTLTDAELERVRRQSAELGIVTRDPGVLALVRDLQKAARASLPIVLAGEPGTGKELFARAAHRLSPRAAGPFVAVNMAAIPPELFESEMFGHVRGSFTGAVGDRKGHFEQAHGGTLFLDEIGELRAEHQAKLLRVLQDGSFHRVGAGRPTAVDVRIVVASNRDLARGVADGWFREDLYFRLRGIVLQLPPLRERRHDVAPLAEHCLDALAAEAGRRTRLSEAALRALVRHSWPGNVRELQGCLRRAVALTEHEVLTPEDLRLEAAVPKADGDGDATVLDCLRRHGFDMQTTARALGCDRSTVTQRLKGMGFQALVDSGGDRSRAAAVLAGDPGLARTVELKLTEYHEHLLRSVAALESADAAVAASRRRFKNLPDRYFAALEILVRQSFK
jgi:DNA-binding NtrC family response regulator/CHASE2 domain-containing sensor protein